MIDEELTSKLALLLYNVYEVNYLTCLAVQEMEEKAKIFDKVQKSCNTDLDNLSDKYQDLLKEYYKVLEEKQNLKNGIKAMFEDYVFSSVWRSYKAGHSINFHKMPKKDIDKIEDMLEELKNDI